MDIFYSDEEKMKFTVYKEEENFRLCSITSLRHNVTSLRERPEGFEVHVNPVKDGLGIEYTDNGGQSYIVIAMPRYHKDEGYGGFESVSDRVETCCDTWKKVQIFYRMLEEAKKILIAEKEKEEEEE